MDINNNEKDIRLVDIGEQSLANPNWRPQNKQLSKLSSTFRKVMFSESKFVAGTSVLDTQYKYPGSQNNNLFYFFNKQLDYALAQHFTELEITKHNIDRFFTNLLIKFIIKKLSYCNSDK